MGQDLEYWDIDDPNLNHEGNQGIRNLWLGVEDCLCLIRSSSLRPHNGYCMRHSGSKTLLALSSKSSSMSLSSGS
jgi:hypothetical protein